MMVRQSPVSDESGQLTEVWVERDGDVIEANEPRGEQLSLVLPSAMASSAPRGGRVQAAAGARRAGAQRRAWTRPEHGATLLPPTEGEMTTPACAANATDLRG